LLHDVVLALLRFDPDTMCSASTLRRQAGGDGVLTLPDYIYATYNDLLSAGWRMNDIVNMDMWAFSGTAWRLTVRSSESPKRRYIDEVWLMIRIRMPFIYEERMVKSRLARSNHNLCSLAENSLRLAPEAPSFFCRRLAALRCEDPHRFYAASRSSLAY
jgi:hypothetical protein